jgi:acetyltransferase-like isoleucine patch superfamily enzyme
MNLPEPFVRAVTAAAERVRPGAAGVLGELPPSAVAKIAAMSLRAALVRPRLGSAGQGLLVGRSVTLRDAARIRVGSGVIVEDGVEIQGRSSRGITLGSRVTIRNNSMIRPSSYYGRREGEGCSIGDGSNVGAMCYIGCAGFIEIGRDVLMGSLVQLIAEEHVVPVAAAGHGAGEAVGAGASIKDAGTTRTGITIGDGCWLGAGSIILDGVELGAGCIVGAGAVVTRSYPAGTVLTGVPARPQSNADAAGTAETATDAIEGERPS